MNDVMIRNCNTGEYLSEIDLFSIPPARCDGVLRFCEIYDALLFEKEDIAQATIDFISNVIDFEMAEFLEVVVVPS